MSEDKTWNEYGERMYPDYIKESQAAYKATKDPALGRMLAKKQGEYTVEDYYALPEKCRVELIDGVIYNMAVPTWTHQGIIGILYYQLRSYIEQKRGDCLIRLSPCDVEFDEDNKTVVQPDLFILCKKKEGEIKKSLKITKPVPDFVVEVLSPSTRLLDRKIKYPKYKRAGVREYWIVDPQKQLVDVYILENQSEGETGGMISYSGIGPSATYSFDEQIPVHIYGGRCKVTLSDMEREIELQETLGYF